MDRLNFQMLKYNRYSVILVAVFTQFMLIARVFTFMLLDVIC